MHHNSSYYNGTLARAYCVNYEKSLPPLVKTTPTTAATPFRCPCQTETKESELKTNAFEILCEFVVGHLWKKKRQYIQV